MIGCIEVAILTFTIIICILTYFKWKFQYWHRKQAPFIEPTFPFGTNGNLFKQTQHSAIVYQKQYTHLKSLGHKFGGLYILAKPMVLVVDVELMKNIMCKDFQYFTDRGLYYTEKDDPLGAHLFTLEGEKWRNLRAKITPTFTTGKIRKMFGTLLACGDPLHKAVTELYEKKLPFDVKYNLERFTTDVIASCAFGLECNSFTEPTSDFHKYGDAFLKSPTTFQAIIKFILITLSPKLGRLLKITFTNPEIRKFFLNTVRETVYYRRRHNIVRYDFMQLVMGLMQHDHNENGLTIEQVAAQAFVFFVAGFETSSSTVTSCLYELAINQEIQKRVRDEINATLEKHGGNITYDAIMEMKYLSRVVDETLRKYPPLTAIPRICVQDYKVPETNIVIEKGTRVIIPVYALHHDPQFYPNPEKFDPDRFDSDNKVNMKPFSYMPFGEGPRICIGLRFGLIETKVGLIVLLKDFNFSLNEKTKYPLELDRNSFLLNLDGGVWLDIEKV